MADGANSRGRRGAAKPTLHAHLRVNRRRRRGARFLRRLALWLVVAAGASWGLWEGGRLAARRVLLENPKYNLVHLDIELSGRLRRDQVLAWADIPSDANLLGLDIRRIQLALERQPQVATAEIRKKLPNRLWMRVAERRPLARITIGVGGALLPASCFIVDREGMIMRPRPGEPVERLPEIRGVRIGDLAEGRTIEAPSVFGALNLLAMIEQSPVRAELDVVSVDVSEAGCLGLCLPKGGFVRFSDESSELGRQVQWLQRILNHCARERRVLRTADLTLTRNVPVTYAPAEG